MEVRLGAFGRLKDFPQMERSGFAYGELDAAELSELSEEEFQRVKERLGNSPLRTEIFGRALPWDQPIFGGVDFDWEEFCRFAEKSCRRMKELGARKWILGNGKARSLPEGREQYAREQFCRLLDVMCDTAEKNGIAVLLEPLGPRYTNFIHTIGQAAELCQSLRKDNLFVMCDLRHMVDSGDDFRNIIRCRDYLRHVHIDNPLLYPRRIYPSLSDGYDYSGYFQALKEIDYRGTLTVEAEVPEDFAGSFREMEEFLAYYQVPLGTGEKG